MMPDSPGMLRLIEALGPAMVVAISVGIAYGGIQTQLDTQADALRKLEPMPLQMAAFESKLTVAMSNIRVDQASKVNDIMQRVATVEQRSQRSYENIQSLWEIVRANQGKPASVIR